MNKILIVIAFCFAAVFCRAQGTLQFNQIRLFNLQVTAGGATYPETVQSVTVPVGKVLKIESAYCSLSYSTGASVLDGRIMLDNRMIWAADLSSYAAANRFPIWLPSGTYTLRLYQNCISCSTSNNPVIYGTVSAIEFNIIP